MEKDGDATLDPDRHLPRRKECLRLRLQTTDNVPNDSPPVNVANVNRPDIRRCPRGTATVMSHINRGHLACRITLRLTPCQRGGRRRRSCCLLCRHPCCQSYQVTGEKAPVADRVAACTPTSKSNVTARGNESGNTSELQVPSTDRALLEKALVYDEVVHGCKGTRCHLPVGDEQLEGATAKLAEATHVPWPTSPSVRDRRLAAQKDYP